MANSSGFCCDKLGTILEHWLLSKHYATQQSTLFHLILKHRHSHVKYLHFSAEETEPPNC